jgi:hypothetical protein
VIGLSLPDVRYWPKVDIGRNLFAARDTGMAVVDPAGVFHCGGAVHCNTTLCLSIKRWWHRSTSRGLRMIAAA